MKHTKREREILASLRFLVTASMNDVAEHMSSDVRTFHPSDLTQAFKHLAANGDIEDTGLRTRNFRDKSAMKTAVLYTIK